MTVGGGTTPPRGQAIVVPRRGWWRRRRIVAAAGVAYGAAGWRLGGVEGRRGASLAWSAVRRRDAPRAVGQYTSGHTARDTVNVTERNVTQRDATRRDATRRGATRPEATSGTSLFSSTFVHFLVWLASFSELSSSLWSRRVARIPHRSACHLRRATE